MPAASARDLSPGAKDAPPTRTASNAPSASTDAASASSRCSCVGTRLRYDGPPASRPRAATTSKATTGSVPASTER